MNDVLGQCDDLSAADRGVRPRRQFRLTSLFEWIAWSAMLFWIGFLVWSWWDGGDTAGLVLPLVLCIFFVLPGMLIYRLLFGRAGRDGDSSEGKFAD